MTQGDRLVLQIQFSNSLYGTNYPPCLCLQVLAFNREWRMAGGLHVARIAIKRWHSFDQLEAMQCSQNFVLRNCTFSMGIEMSAPHPRA